MEIVFLDQEGIAIHDIDFSGLQVLGAYKAFDESDEGEIIERAGRAEVVITNKAPIGAAVLENLPNLKLVTVIATGYDNVDIDAAKRRGVCVCNIPAYAADSVAQHTFALILNLATKAYLYYNDIQEGKWNEVHSFTLLKYPTFELAGKTIGIIGFGAIGRRVAAIADSFGMKVLVNDIAGIRDAAYPNMDLETILDQADIVTLHCPLTEADHNLIDARALARMKNTALLINTARGGLVDERALYDALESGLIAGAGIDVIRKEPPREGDILFGAKNIIITPHSAWSTHQARQRLVDETAKNIRAFIEGKPRNVVV
jgi:glycerate dehydrogenase